MPRVLAICALAVLVQSSAYAQDAPIPDPAETALFYNRPGVTAAERDRVEAACREFAVEMLPRPTGPGEYGLVGAVITAVAQSRFEASFERQSQEYVDDCMIAQGYRRFQVAATSAERLQQRLSDRDASTQDEWAGGTSPPEGVLARAFTNSNWLPGPGDAAIAGMESVAPPQALAMTYSFGVGLPYRGQNPREEISLEPTDAALVASITTTAPGDFSIALMAVDDANQPAISLGRRARFFLAGHGNQTTTRAFVVPAGRYVIVGVSYERLPRFTGRQFCLRTATFTLRAGETQYLGDFVMEIPDDREPDQFAGRRQGAFQAPRFRINQAGLEVARAALSRAPQLASTLVPVSWSNGASFPCYAFSDIGSFDWQAPSAN